MFHILSSSDSLIVLYRLFWISTSPSTFHLYTLRQSFSPSHTLTCTSRGYDSFPHFSLLLYVNLLHLLPGIVSSHWNQIPPKTSLCRFSLITPTVSSTILLADCPATLVFMEFIYVICENDIRLSQRTQPVFILLHEA